MSTLRVDTLQNVAGSGQPAMSGAAKAWVNFNGIGTVAINSSFNVSSITDNGVGRYAVNFTTALTDGNYSVAGVAGNQGTSLITDGNFSPPLISTSARVASYAPGATGYQDNNPFCIAVFR
jgi:hypothetical protein